MLSYTGKQVGPFYFTAGVTRVVMLTRRWAIKVPQPDYFLRGWLANQSEWHQRRRLDVEPPRVSVFHFILVSRRALQVGAWDPDEFVHDDDETRADERKGSSWGLFPEGWRLVDFDRMWERRSPLAKLYCWNEDRKARKWLRLPQADDPAADQ